MNIKKVGGKNIVLKFNQKKIYLEVQECKSLFSKVRGLMFRRRKNAPALLLFEENKPLKLKIHSWFCFFPFVAIWADSKGNILEFQVVKSWRTIILPEKPFYKLIEIPLNLKYRRGLESLVES